ncbi:hypothetical protein [Priestia megaterium]|uniref:hypothetical protein n=1 Tax=Priestia megaterium TaxID=1404 RepID=UPI000BF4EE74|nr:hypothetical protein [Priestia megaterium]MED3971304.1 hypothetical protein [Priestia megaterium]PES95145.1 hypothetical protein CN510_16540 [Priestia megaterium]PEX09422.1 hypothetical protein CN451_15975 [Priestia megaterium]QLC90644.1 hypothetical protein HW576_29275 [Priestia megaterium]
MGIQAKIKEILLVLLTLLLVISILVHLSNYFNSKEIQSFSSQCYDQGGEVILKIHNPVINNYSFTCK